VLSLSLLTLLTAVNNIIFTCIKAYIYILAGINYKTTTLLLDGKRIKLQLWYALQIDVLSLLV